MSVAWMIWAFIDAEDGSDPLLRILPVCPIRVSSMLGHKSLVGKLHRGSFEPTNIYQ